MLQRYRTDKRPVTELIVNDFKLVVKARNIGMCVRPVIAHNLRRLETPQVLTSRTTSVQTEGVCLS